MDGARGTSGAGRGRNGGGKGRNAGNGRNGGQARAGAGRPGRSADGGRGGQGEKPRSGARPARPGGERRGPGAASGERKSGRPGRDSRQGRERTPRSSERGPERERYDGPPIPEQITGRELDRSVTAQLKSLPDKLAVRVARHLVAAGQLIESDPKTAYEHTLAARARAARLAIVREAVGEAAYAAGEYGEALAELRAARRMNGSNDYVAVMADCERALGRPDRALTLLRNNARGNFSADQEAELVIVEAGARRDRGELEAALRRLELAPLGSRSRAPWVARLRYTYADTLAAAGRVSEAIEWFHRTEAVDGPGLTDAAERAAELEGSLEQD